MEGALGTPGTSRPGRCEGTWHVGFILPGKTLGDFDVGDKVSRKTYDFTTFLFKYCMVKANICIMVKCVVYI